MRKNSEKSTVFKWQISKAKFKPNPTNLKKNPKSVWSAKFLRIQTKPLTLCNSLVIKNSRTCFVSNNNLGTPAVHSSLCLQKFQKSIKKANKIAEVLYKYQQVTMQTLSPILMIFFSLNKHSLQVFPLIQCLGIQL